MNFISEVDKSYLSNDRKLLVINGWNYGFQKVEFTNMLREELGYSLSLAMNITDEVLAKHSVELPVPLNKFEHVSGLVHSLGAVVPDREKETIS